MIRNVEPAPQLKSLVRKQKSRFEYVTVKKEEVEAHKAVGWEVEKRNLKSVRLRRPKKRSVLLEDRVWSLMYRMGFEFMSAKGGAELSVKAGDKDGPTDQLDVVAIDNEVAIAIECKSALKPKHRDQLQREINHLAASRRRFINAVQKQFPVEPRQMAAQAFFLWDVVPRERDTKAAEDSKIKLYDVDDLEYFEALTSHLGPAAKYQFLAELLAGREIRGLERSIPALRAKMGRHSYYTFSVSPDYLLKISCIAHRAGGQRADLGAYQRMVEKKRLKQISKYISDHGVFPTNIVVNFEGKRTLRFHHREKHGAQEGARYGMLNLKPTFGCAWVIDGQHRLFAYSGHELAETSFLNVLAFENLSIEKQAELFIDINHEQRAVKKSLLQELFATLKWAEEDETERVRAIISRAISELNRNPESPLHNRILFTGQGWSETRCVTINSVFTALNKSGMFVVKKNVEYGPMWADTPQKTVTRTATVISGWLSLIREGAPDWWDAGAGEGGGLAMTDGIAMCIALLRSVLQHLEGKGYRLTRLANQEVVTEIRPYGEEVGRYLGSLTEGERATFRGNLRGNQGQTARRRECEQHLHQGVFPDFDPPGLKEHQALLRAKTTSRAYELVSEIEMMLKEVVVGTLKREIGPADTEWWYKGVPEGVRLRISDQMEKEKSEGDKEDGFQILDYRKIIAANWPKFRADFGYGGSGKKDGTKWINRLNEIRKPVMHRTRGLPTTFEQLEELGEYKGLLEKASRAFRTAVPSE